MATSITQSLAGLPSGTGSIEFRPHPLLRGGHLQTFAASVWGGASYPHRARGHIVATTDGDRLVLHDDRPESWRAGDPCALLVHGLGGSHRSTYMVRAAHKLERQQVRTFRLDLRGCGAGYHLAQKPGHAGRSEDTAAAVAAIEQLAPGSPVIVVGFSLGANIVLKMLSEWGEQVPRAVIRAMAVAPPIDLFACARNLARPAMAAYNRWFVKMLLQQSRERRAFIPELAAIDWSCPPRTLYEFDDRVTAPLSGYAGADEYYARCSSCQRLGDIRVPTWILAAQDDPIVPASLFEGWSSPASVALHITRYGGHVAYIGRAGRDPDRFWLDWRIVDFVLAPVG